MSVRHAGWLCPVWSKDGPPSKDRQNAPSTKHCTEYGVRSTYTSKVITKPCDGRTSIIDINDTAQRAHAGQQMQRGCKALLRTEQRPRDGMLRERASDIGPLQLENGLI